MGKGPWFSAAISVATFPRYPDLQHVPMAMLVGRERGCLADQLRGSLSVTEPAECKSRRPPGGQARRLRTFGSHPGMSDQAIMELNLPTGIPIVYELDQGLKPIKPMRFLGDEETVRKAMEAVAAQGKAK